MGAIAAELQFSSCSNPVLSGTRHCSSKSRRSNCGYYHGIGPSSSNSRIGGSSSSSPGLRGGGGGAAVAFGFKSWAGTDPLVSSWAGRWVPQTQCVGEGSVRQIRSLKKSFDGERRLLGGGLRWKGRRRAMAVQLLWGRVEAPKPDFVALVQITGEEHFDQLLNEAAERNQPIVVDWLAAWCRKCIYLKPKIEKLAAEYHPDIKFYYIDVNTVPQALVKRANVTKMPTIQLWKDGQHVAEVIGGHQAWLVMDEVRQMIDSRK